MLNIFCVVNKDEEKFLTDWYQANGNEAETEMVAYDEHSRFTQVYNMTRGALSFHDTDVLAKQTGLSPGVFAALQSDTAHNNHDTCEAILRLVESTCGLKKYVENIISFYGYGYFLTPYFDDEIKVECQGREFFLYYGERYGEW